LAGPAVRSSNLQFFLARAEQARAEAEAATLDHVRERCRRSEAAWSALADKAHRGERLRIEDQKRKAAVAASISNEDDIQEEPTEADFPTSERRTTSIRTVISTVR
jgi:hypothetical protein